MAARSFKSDEELILDDHLDALRTVARLKSRQQIRRELNTLESQLREKHEKGGLGPLEFNLSALVNPQLASGGEEGA
jgi:hypothetical protein